MESPTVGAWSTTLPANWSWSPGTGTGNVGLTSTGGANGSQQTFWGNGIAGVLTSNPLPETLANPSLLKLSYWTKRENTGSITVNAEILVNGSVAAARSDIIASSVWTQYTLEYPTGTADVGKALSVRFTYLDKVSPVQGYLDEVTLKATPLGALPEIHPTIYPYDVVPATYPDYSRRTMAVASWSDYQNQPQFVGSRGNMDETYFDRWTPILLAFTPTNSGPAVVKIENANCDGTVLVDEVALQQTSGPVELLANSDFEGSTGWVFSAGSGYTNSQSHSTSRSAAIAVSGKVNASPKPTTLQAGHTYLCSVWVKTAATGNWVITFGNWQAGGEDQWINRATSGNEWEQFSAVITPTALTGNYNQFQVSSSGADDWIYVDDFSVRELSSAGTNFLTNPGFETADPGQGWMRTAGVNVYPDGHNSSHSMLVRAGHALQATVNVQAGQTYQTTAWLSVAGRSQGEVRITVGAPGLGSVAATNDSETTSLPSGLVNWPNVSKLVNGLTTGQLDALVNHQAILHNPGGYGPGAAWTGSFGQALASSAALADITNRLGSRFTGADIGEQDARFANVFEGVYEPFSQLNAFHNYQVAHRYIGQVGDDLGNIMSLLVNLWYWHYPVKDGNVMAVGAQTQPKEGISNSQLHYSFLRGAGKQYGVPWFGNVSVFSTDWDRGGPQPNSKSYPTQSTNGNSLNLMRRLMFTHYLYGCNILSFEGGLRTTDSNTVSPIGMVQEAMVQTVNQYGRAGIMHTPVALLLDFQSGWMPAQHNRGNYYVWNNVDYGPGDHLTHNLFSLLYPSYEANGFYQNELGGLSDTPYGDIADTLLSDVSAPVLSRYGVAVAAGDLPSADTELWDKVEAFLANGGNFIVTGENARRLWPEYGIGPGQTTIPANGVVSWIDAATSTETNSGKLYSVSTGLLPYGYQVLASYGAVPAVIDIPRGAGRITLLLSPMGINDTALGSLHPPNSVGRGYNTPLPKPFVLMAHVQRLLDNRFSSQRLFSVGNSQLGYVTTRRAPCEYFVGIHNNSLVSRSFNISSMIGSITNLTELDLGRSVTNELGYWPLGYASNNGGISDASNIFGGDIRLFRVQVDETNSIHVLSSNLPPARPFNRMVAVPTLCNLKEALLGWPAFFEHFDGVKLDWADVRSADLDSTNGGAPQLREPINWLKRQQVRFVTDFSSGFLLGKLTLQTNAPGTNYQQSLAVFNEVMDKLAILGRATDVIITTEEVANGQTDALKAGVAALCANAAARGITVHLKHRATSWTPDVAATLSFIASVGTANLKFAANTADAANNLEGSLSQAGAQLGLILIAPPGNGAAVDLSPVRSRNVVQILDAEYTSWDSVYRDIRSAWTAAGANTLAGSPIVPPLEVYWTTHSNNAARFLSLNNPADLPAALRQQTNFWKYFGGVKVDYKYLADRDPAECVRQARWLAERKVQVVMDFSSGLNNYPGLTLTDSSNSNDGLSANYERSIEIINDVFDKMALMSVTNCIFRPTTTNAAAYTDVCNRAWARGHIRVHLQHYMSNWMTTYQSPASVVALVDDAAPANGNLQMAVNGCHDGNLSGLLNTAGSRLGVILLGYPGSMRADVHGQARLGMNKAALAGHTEPQILDSEYADWNDTALDLAYLGWNPSVPPIIPYSQITTKPPVFQTLTLTNGGVIFSGSGGASGAAFSILGATNLVLPISNWTVLDTSQFDAYGGFLFTNAIAVPQRFYRLQMQ